MVVELVIALGAGGAMAVWQLVRSRPRKAPPVVPPTTSPYREGQTPLAPRDATTGGYPTPPFGDDR